MKNVKFELEVDLSDKRQTDAFNALLVAIGGQSAETPEKPVQKTYKKGQNVKFRLPYTENATLFVVKEDFEGDPVDNQDKLEAINETPEKPKRKKRTKAEIEADKKADQEEAHVEEKQQEEAPAESEIKLTEVRALLGKKVNIDRDGCVAKLKELGAKNVSTLDPEHYQDFVDYLNSLG